MGSVTVTYDPGKAGVEKGVQAIKDKGYSVDSDPGNDSEGVHSLYTSSVKLRGGTSIALGPVGGGGKVNVTADFIAFSRSKGAYAGLNLEGSVVSVRDSLNKAYYRKEVTPVQIIVEKKVSNAGSAQLRSTLKKAAK